MDSYVSLYYLIICKFICIYRIFKCILYISPMISNKLAQAVTRGGTWTKPAGFFRYLLSPFRPSPRWNLTSSHDEFLPHHFQWVTHQNVTPLLYLRGSDVSRQCSILVCRVVTEGTASYANRTENFATPLKAFDTDAINSH